MQILHRGEDERGRRVDIKISFEGKDITLDVSDSLISCNYRDSINEFDSIEVTFHDRQGFWISEWAPQKGDKLEVAYTLHNWKDEKNVQVAVGTFFLDSITYSGTPDVISLKGVSVDLETNIMDGRECRDWEQVTIRKIAEDIAEKCGMELMCDFDFDRVYDRVEQKLESDYTLLKRLCQEAGINIKIYSNKLILFEESKYEHKEPFLTIKKGDDTSDYSFSMDDADTYAGCKISYFDYMLDKKIEHSFFTKQRPGYKRNTQRVLFLNEDKTPPGETAEQKKEYLLKLAQKALREKNKSGITGSFEILGQSDILSSGDVINVVGFGRFDAKYIVTELTTDLDTYKHSVRVRQCLEEY